MYSVWTFFFNRQFITQCAKADHGSYFCNYVQKRHANQENRREKREEKEKKKKWRGELINEEREKSS